MELQKYLDQLRSIRENTRASMELEQYSEQLRPIRENMRKQDEMMLFGRVNFEENLVRYATVAMDYYNLTHQNRFELVKPLYMEMLDYSTRAELGKYIHLSFIARSQGSSPKHKMFFAELTEQSEEVMTCTIVEPGNRLFPLSCVGCHPAGVIYHPPTQYDEVDDRRWYMCSPPRGGKRLSVREKSVKNILCDEYVLKENMEQFDAEEDERLRDITRGYIGKALDYYYDMNQSDFELVEPLTSVRFGDPDAETSLGDANVWAHITFKAREKDQVDASPHIFFAELSLDLSWISMCVNMTEDFRESLSYGSNSSCTVCRDVCLALHPEGCVAGRSGGTFADAQVKGLSFGIKVELQPKIGASIEANGVEVGQPSPCNWNEK